MSKKSSVYIGIITLLLSLVYCSVPKQEGLAFRSLKEEAKYMGMKTCMSCHKDVYDSYIHTGMGQSFENASLTKTAAKFGEHHVVYDSTNNLYYKPSFRDSQMYVLEYRVEGGDTTHKREEAIAHIIGSGHHTNSHMINRNGYVYQAPITFYTQKEKWDLAPGYEVENQGFNRLISSECLTCHNHFPKLMPGSEHKYLEMPQGIECERCHGPGELHVREKLAGIIVDTATGVDYSIINPRHLPIERQMDLCQRCHLQGVAVLNEGKTFYDFHAGMHLDSVMNVYLPRFSDSDKRFIMASQADRLKLSNCYLESKELSCITCHNPHHDVHSRSKNRYNESCKSCHHPKTVKSQLKDCSVGAEERSKKNNDCVACHMPKSGSIDIPHVNITDHNISRVVANNYLSKVDTEEIQEIKKFLGLQSLLRKNPSKLEMAKAYLALYDKFMATKDVLDSAYWYLERAEQNQEAYLAVAIHYHFTKENFSKVQTLSQGLSSKVDAWTAYRVGEAYYKSQSFSASLKYYEQACTELPYSLDFQEKMGLNYARIGKLKKAEQVFNFVLSEDPKRKKALNNIALIHAQRGQLTKALKLYDKALSLDPDYEQAILNKVATLIQFKRKEEARQALEHYRAKIVNQQRLNSLELLLAQ